MTRRIISCLLALVLVFGSLTVTAWAGEATERILPTLKSEKDFVRQTTYILEEAVDTDALRAHLYEGMSRCESSIDVSSFGIRYTDEMWKAVGSFIFYEMPECFHVTTFGGSVNGEMMISLISPKYSMDAQDYVQTKAACDAVASRLISGIPADGSMGEAEKALLIHDRLAVWCEYDVSMALPNSHSMVGALRDGVAVCQGYAMAYSYLLRQVGMKSRYCASDLMNHGWNIVTVDGVDYHVDVTWDDPTPDITGRVMHTNFLLSSDGIRATGHSENGTVDYDTRPKDSRYEGASWVDSTTEFQLLNGQLYYIDGKREVLASYPSGETLCEVEDQWTAAGGIWPGNYARLSSDGEKLLYSLSDGIYSFDPKTGDGECLAKADLTLGEHFAVYGFTYRDGYGLCDRSDTPNFSYSTKEQYGQKIPLHSCRFDCEVAKEEYLFSPADCDSPAVYYKSCSCGKAGQETFAYGSPKGHGETRLEWDAEGHYAICTVCSETVSVAEHRYTDGKDAVCEDCPYQRYRSNALWVYTEDGYGGILLVDYLGKGSEVKIPSQIGGEKVLTLGEGLLSDCDTLTRVKLPKSVQRVREGALNAPLNPEILYEGTAEEWEQTEFSSQEEREALEAKVSFSVSMGTALTGDANGDETVTFGDIQRIYQHLSSANKISAEQMDCADANGDGSVTFGDIQRIYQHLAGGQKLF